ncbi:hypothetical protein CROQUDRAFT_89685 [Cronartium quercuum f. sp. fusiforme G11]|uniref:Inhibitor I9 domain-containing protein n=1 Tax=Cronartium quercuum f. sp. fusiforme G11 TaxID=708437 RepID=A0A9P6NRE1_9BASI|nr:hypothetical protein CROQUDRAFT_89685 [Cronartium quercuum f. sp. fusiforme G11]
MSSADTTDIAQADAAIATDPSLSNDTDLKTEENAQPSIDELAEESVYSKEPKHNFLITLKPGTTTEELDEYEKQLQVQGGTIRHKYNSVLLKGFAVSLPESRLEGLSEDPNIQYVEPDGDVHI